MDEQLSRAVTTWHLDNGGYCDTPAVYKYHTLRLLHEAVELCLASGAMSIDIGDVIADEINKHREKNRSFGRIDLQNMSEEIADVAILLEVFAGYTEITVDDVVHDKLGVLHERKWIADEHGVLWRKRDDGQA